MKNILDKIKILTRQKIEKIFDAKNLELYGSTITTFIRQKNKSNMSNYYMSHKLIGKSNYLMLEKMKSYICAYTNKKQLKCVIYYTEQTSY